MMRLGHYTARRALTQSLASIRPASSPSSISISQLAAFSTCNARQHSKSPAVRQEQSQTTPPSSSPIAYQSFRPDPNRRPVILLYREMIDDRNKTVSWILQGKHFYSRKWFEGCTLSSNNSFVLPTQSCTPSRKVHYRLDSGVSMR